MEDALQAGWRAVTVFYSADLSARGQKLLPVCRDRGAEVLEISPELMHRISDTGQPQGILAIFPIPELIVPDPPQFVVILDQIRDPGNLGTILRSAAAGGVQAVWLAPGCVDPFSPKVLRSGMGAHFHLPVQSRTWGQIRAAAEAFSLNLMLADSQGGTPVWEADLTRPIAILIGSEADGAGAEARASEPELVHIPMPGGFESLNAGAAASILIFEAVRQRRQR